MCSCLPEFCSNCLPITCGNSPVPHVSAHEHSAWPLGYHMLLHMRILLGRWALYHVLLWTLHHMLLNLCILPGCWASPPPCLLQKAISQMAGGGGGGGEGLDPGNVLPFKCHCVLSATYMNRDMTVGPDRSFDKVVSSSMAFVSK